MKKIKWLTEEQVQRAARRGRKAALLCSIKHWEQLSSADREQVRDRGSFYVLCNYCALCTRYDFGNKSFTACNDCKLHCLTQQGRQGSPWGRALDAFDLVDDCDSRSWRTWKRTSKALLRRIIKLYESEYGEYTNVER